MGLFGIAGPSHLWLSGKLGVPAPPPVAISGACGKLEVSYNGADWFNISGESQSVQNTMQSRQVANAFRLSSRLAIVGAGRREPMDLAFTIVYTETDAEAYEIVKTRYEQDETICQPYLYARWSPRGGNVGDARLTTDTGTITNFIYPALDASAGGVIMGGFTLRVGFVTTEIIAS